MSNNLLTPASDLPLEAGDLPGFASNDQEMPCPPKVAGPLARRMKGARAIAREEAQAAASAGRAADTAILRAQVQHGFKPPRGKQFSVDIEGLMLIGPAGGIGVTSLMARTMEILTAPGRHAPEALLPAGWRDMEHLLEGFEAFVPKLGVLGLRFSQTPTGWRINPSPSGSK
ncbi:hypothetical protein [Methylobacterium sp. CM6247]